MRSHIGEIGKQFQKQDTVQEANPPYLSPVTVHMKQAGRIRLQYTNSHTDIVQKKEQKPRQGMSRLDVICPSLIPAAFPRPGLPCSILCFWILHHLIVFSWARMSSRQYVLQRRTHAQPRSSQPDANCCSHAKQKAIHQESQDRGIRKQNHGNV